MSLDFSDVDANRWPLISYLYEDVVYRAVYDGYVQEVVDGAFNVSFIQSQYSLYSSLIEPYATSEIEGYSFLNDASEFQSAVMQLNAHVSERSAAVNNYLK